MNHSEVKDYGYWFSNINQLDEVPTVSQVTKSSITSGQGPYLNTVKSSQFW